MTNWHFTQIKILKIIIIIMWLSKISTLNSSKIPLSSFKVYLSPPPNCREGGGCDFGFQNIGGTWIYLDFSWGNCVKVGLKIFGGVLLFDIDILIICRSYSLNTSFIYFAVLFKSLLPFEKDSCYKAIYIIVWLYISCNSRGPWLLGGTCTGV